ncbi:MAG: hypothetical protein PUC72_02945 [Bacteroidales bacterium]|nr:hypothetical protein [Bacteroidales bacterium]
MNCYSSSIPAGLIEFSSPCVIVDSTGRQFISEVSRNQGPLEYMPKYEIEAYSRIDLNELSLISRENALCYYEYVDKGSQKYLIMCESADGLLYANQLNFDGWDASFDLKLIPFTEKRRDRSMSFMKWMSFLVWTKWALPQFTGSFPDTYVLKGLNLHPGLIRLGYYTIAVNDAEYLVYNAYSDYLEDGIRIIADNPFETEETNIHIQNYTVRRITNPKEYTFELKLDRTESGLFKAVLVGIKKNSSNRP